MQLAAAYAALVNGGYYMKPTIISQIINKGSENTEQEISSYQEKKKIFKNSTSEAITK
ncbi:hypothetical protein IJU97_00080 [bacterium]|nr:hypothetical protein [bacterium]